MQTAATTVPTAYRHRVSRTIVRVLGPDGAPVAATPVETAQTAHAFAFGNVGADFISSASGREEDGSPVAEAEARRAEHVADLWFDLYNTATLPFYWGRFEPTPGRPDTERMRATAQWLVDRGVVVKGHPLLWHTVAPQWLLDVPADQVEGLARARITREVTDMAGVVTWWDAINEVVIMPEFTAEENAITPLAQRLGRVGVVRLAFETARAADPTVKLVLNDFTMTARYEQLISDVLDAGITIDAIGLQSHMHQGWWGSEKTADVLDRFARFGIPLHFTETTLVSGHLMPPEIVDLNDYQIPSWPSTPEGEARQAEEMAAHYRALVAHPAVEAITYWGFSDRGAWLGAPGGLLRADDTPKPSYDALRDLIKGEWWLSPTTVTTDADGRLAVEGFSGTYRVSAGGRTAELVLDGSGDAGTPDEPAEVTLTLA